MPEQELYNHNTGRYQTDGNAVRVPVPDIHTGADDENEHVPQTIGYHLRRNVMLISMISLIMLLVGSMAFFSFKEHNSNKSVVAMQGTVSDLQNKLSSQKQDYNSRISGIDISSYAENKLGMILSDESVELTLTQISDEAN